DADIDGVDLDYEPEGDWMQGENFTKLVQYIGQYFGPQGSYPDKLLIVDFYSQYPPAETEPYVNYYIRQAYTQGFTEHSAARLQSYYNSITWAAPEKFIVTENFGSWYENGGSPFTEADGNTLTTDGSRMYSLEGMARWNPVQGKKAGFGAFYVDRDYYSKAGPYYNMRRCIQIANPAVR
ncbi:MAG: glycoside hydrolase family 18, partial [Mangrovibacterium sp.]|nr:glycoside hydrolase family 18 [Mangrovibacterium sp.]